MVRGFELWIPVVMHRIWKVRARVRLEGIGARRRGSESREWAGEFVASSWECKNSHPYIVEARELEHGFRRISARIPYTLP